MEIGSGRAGWRRVPVGALFVRAFAPPPELSRVAALLAPAVRAARNRWNRLGCGGRLRLGGLAVLGVAFCGAIFAFFHRALTYFLSFPDFGPILTGKLLGMLFLGFFSILLISNLITALSTFFLSPDLERLVAAPLAPGALFYARLSQSVAESSWMVVVFALPSFLAYGTAHHCGPVYYLVVAALLPPFLLIPATIGVAGAAVLVNFFPARRAREVLLVLSAVAVAVLYTWLRVLQPERLAHPEEFAGFAHFLATLATPHSPFLPSTWAAEAVLPFLGRRGGSAFFPLLLLYATATTFTLACEDLLERLFLPGLSRAQEGRRAAVGEKPFWERLLLACTRLFPAHTRLLVLKDARTFARDSTQWSQLILLTALAVVYVYNFSLLSLRGGLLVTFYFTNAVAFLNLALAGFVTAAVSARLVFPSISLEGRAFWVTRTAPVAPERIWWSKFWIGVVPLLALGEVLVVATNRFLGVAPFMTWLSVVTLAGMTFAIVALALAVGAAYPRFDTGNAATIAAGFGGIVYMAACVSFIGVVALLEAWPVYAIFTSRLHGVGLAAGERAGVALSLGAAALLTVGVFGFSVRSGIRRLANLEV